MTGWDVSKRSFIHRLHDITKRHAHAALGMRVRCCRNPGS